MKKLFPIIFLILALIGCSKSGSSNNKYVDPFIGTGGHGHTYPGATVPFGMVQLSPDNGTQGWDWCSGYHTTDSVIVGFSHTHLSGTGIGDLYDISIMPHVGDADLTQIVGDYKELNYSSTFSHDNESAEPGYYSVLLDKGKIQVELTATERTGFHRYIYGDDGNAQIVLDLGYAQNWDRTMDTQLNIENDKLITGYRFSKGWANDQKVFFAIQFSKSIVNESTIKDEIKVLDGKGIEKPVKRSKAKFNFNLSGDRELLVKVGISSASIEGAIKGIEEENPSWDFDAINKDASEKWATQLNKIDVVSDDKNIKNIFYTALYHVNLAPTIFSDLNGQYKGPDGKTATVKNRTQYTVFSLWDTFRAYHPLVTITHEEMIPDFINSMLAHYDKYGLLPVWELTGNETNTMTGYHAIPVIADAIEKGVGGFDYERAYEAMKSSGMQDIRDVDAYKKYGFIPTNLGRKNGNQSVTNTLEYAYDDWCIAQVAVKLGKQKDYEYFSNRAKSYTQLFDAKTGFMRGKNIDGSWRSPFDPFHVDHFDSDYTEGNAWQYIWFTPHDPQGLINLFGSREAFIAKLDTLFTVDSELRGKNVSPDVSGLIGQYAHGNEPSHHIAYLYNYAGVPWKTQRMVRKILSEQYRDEPDGLSGNEDCGQMSAWYVLSAMGFYPVNPANGIYVIGSPLFKNMAIDVGGGKMFSIIAENNNDKNIYIQSASLNGAQLNHSFIRHGDIKAGGELKFIMGPEPNKTLWNSHESVPPSMSSSVQLSR